MRAKDGVGKYGERVAVRHLEAQGIEVLECNWRTARGEIDIIGSDCGVLVFVEVKTRSSANYGVPAEAVGRVKANRIRALAASWLAGHPHPYGELRFDVVSVMRQRSGPAEIVHYRNAF